jgi:endonuclease YncB( thermonuclease family)
VQLRRLLIFALAAAALLFGFRENLPTFRGERNPSNRRSTQKWERLEGCELVDSKWNDGDSFHVRHGSRQHLFRLYFVDTPETDDSFPGRTAAQAEYFNITGARALAVGKEARSFTRQRLSGKRFTVWTRWRDALGRSRQPRFYAIVELGGRDLNEELVERGLARIYGTRVPLPDGRDSRSYLAGLSKIEKAARNRRGGAWRFSDTK